MIFLEYSNCNNNNTIKLTLDAKPIVMLLHGRSCCADCCLTSDCLLFPILWGVLFGVELGGMTITAGRLQMLEGRTTRNIM